jgi:hypothetical protein
VLSMRLARERERALTSGDVLCVAVFITANPPPNPLFG